MKRLTLIRPDDYHVHLRDGNLLDVTVPHTARRFARAIVMPNLKPPILTTAEASAYRARIQAAIPQGISFEPLMTLYLTEHTPPSEIQLAKASGCVHAVKLYPAATTTHSEAGVTHLERIYPVLEAMQVHGVPLLIHGEVGDRETDIFDRESVFIERHLCRLLRLFPNLKVVLEHITTRVAVEFVLQAPPTVAATITAHHLLFNRNQLFDGGVRPHYYCLPIFKREEDRLALIQAATSGHAKFFLGTDSAPHAQRAKENDCGCAGIYTAHAALELYAEVFERWEALDKLEIFASINGANFYGLPRNRETVTLVRIERDVPASFSYGQDKIIPLRAGQHVAWRIESSCK